MVTGTHGDFPLGQDTDSPLLEKDHQNEGGAICSLGSATKCRLEIEEGSFGVIHQLCFMAWISGVLPDADRYSGAKANRRGKASGACFGAKG